MMLRNEYPALWHFFGAYLHQDWREEYETPGQALQAFLSSEPDMADRLPGGMATALAAAASSADLERLMVDLGSAFLPSLAETDARAWMHEAEQEATKTLASGPAND